MKFLVFCESFVSVCMTVYGIPSAGSHGLSDTYQCLTFFNIFGAYHLNPYSCFDYTNGLAVSSLFSILLVKLFYKQKLLVYFSQVLPRTE